MLLCKTGLLLHMCHSHYHHVIPNLILIPISSPKATPIPMGIPIPMHTYSRVVRHSNGA